jgi:hypothetical protein
MKLCCGVLVCCCLTGMQAVTKSETDGQRPAGRVSVSLDGLWNMTERKAAIPPVKFDHKAPVPGLADMTTHIGSQTHAPSLEITATNPLDVARSSQTLEVSAADLAPLGEKDLSKIHIGGVDGKEVICQAIDNDGDALRTFDAVVFQTDFSPGETQSFTVTTGEKQVFRKDQFKAFGRFNRERFDDFAWENDRIAHRTYGKALETWLGEPLTSSTIDIWSKRTQRMVINDWYLADDYHDDHGAGADFYAAGPSRGCGGSGLWENDRLWVSNNFVNSKVYANGPVRVMFELEYAPYKVNGINVAETKRITLDAGQQLSRYESRYRSERPASLTTAVGLKKVLGEVVEASPEEGWLLKWEAVARESGNQGLAVIVPPETYAKRTVDELNHLLVLNPNKDEMAVWWAGFCWDRAGQITSAEGWRKYVAAYAKGVAAPIRVAVKPR